MRESDPLTQYLNVVYDVHEATTVILDTTPLPTRPAPPLHQVRRPQTARQFRTTASASRHILPNNLPCHSTMLHRPTVKSVRPQTARPDIGRGPSVATVHDATKAEKAEQKHIRRRLDAFLIGDKAHAHRVFVGVAPEPCQQRHNNDDNDNTESHKQPPHTKPPQHVQRIRQPPRRHPTPVAAKATNVAFVSHARHVRPASREESFVYNFNPSERMIVFQANAHLSSDETMAAAAEMTPVAKLSRRLERHVSVRRAHDRFMTKGGSPPPLHHHDGHYVLGRGTNLIHSPSRIQHGYQPTCKATSHTLNAVRSTQWLHPSDSHATLATVDSATSLHHPRQPCGGGGMKRQPSVVGMTLGASPTRSALKPPSHGATLQDGIPRGMMKRQSSVTALRSRQANSVAEVVQARTKARQIKNRRRLKSGAQYVEEYRDAVAKQRAEHAATATEAHHPTSINTEDDIASQIKYSHMVDGLELWRKHVLSTGLPSSFGAGDDAAPTSVLRMRPRSAGVTRVKPSMF
ncbi:hypothetical protein DYB26_010646 [Aphanomyces astaci]|uniref:Uncharacterized protein n=1 Tax=Aphanomyces astaci TaxID=112090 RepID=A0A397EC31_APHAT|nr:hypothetical protein DYB38_009837 [Aphanomyces astaci]RHZ04607.1 hypothetical protein DYB26_010646 [Aphanomyces astaci]